MKATIVIHVLIVGAIFTLSFSAKSADLVVEENAPQGKYASIVEAVDSAQDGDRIIVKNRQSGNMPWNFEGTNELTIDKSLTFLSPANDTFFRVQGDIYVEHAPGREVTIIGMRNLDGTIGAQSDGTGGFAQVNILDSHFEGGFINFDYDYFRLKAVNNRIDTLGIDLDYGQVIGNDINAKEWDGINVRESNNVSVVDTILILGNRINSTTSGESIQVDNGNAYYDIRNNYANAGGANQYGIYIKDAQNDNNTVNRIYNNTIDDCDRGIYFNGSVSAGSMDDAVFEVMNNVMADAYNGDWGISIYSNTNTTVYAYYNYIHNNFITAIDTDVASATDNITNQTITVNADGTLPSGSDAIDGAKPSTQFYDLDLTRGDAGAYGGSYTLDNFFPLFNGSARVYNVRSPFKAIQGNTFPIEGDSYDR